MEGGEEIENTTVPESAPIGDHGNCDNQNMNPQKKRVIRKQGNGRKRGRTPS